MQIDLDDWDMLPTQEKVYNNDTHKIVMQSAGLGSGKTHQLCRKLIKLSAINQGHPGAILCPTFKDFRRDVKPEMYEILEQGLNLKEGKHFWFHKSYAEFSFIWNKKPLYVLSGEQPIAGPNLAYCGINEFSLIRYERIKEMLRRVRLKDAPLLQRVLVGTPEDVYAWLEEFVDLQEKEEEKKPGSFAIYYADTAENYHVDSEYRDHLSTMLDSKAMQVFASGQIVSLRGDYYYYLFDKQRNVRPVQYDPKKLIYIGMDFNVGKMTASMGQIDLNGQGLKRISFFDELIIEGNSDTKQLAEAICNRFNPKNCMIRCDSSGKARKTSGSSDVQILRKYFPQGNIAHRNANPRHRERQLLMNNLFEKSQIIVDPKCKGLIKDFNKVQQHKVDFSKDKKNEDLTHFSDGADYLVDWEFKQKAIPAYSTWR